MTIKTMDVQEAQTHFSELISLVASGTEVILTQKKLPLIRLISIRMPKEKYDPSMMTPEDESNMWSYLSQIGLNRAYGPDEPEYTLDMIKEFNPEYEGR